MNGQYVITASTPEPAEGYSLRVTAGESFSACVKDSYDYLLMSDGCCLMEKADGSVIFFCGDGVQEYSSVTDGELAARVAKVIAPRILLDKHQLEVRSNGAVLLDELEKTIAKGVMYGIASGDAEVYALSMEPLRGYDKDAAKGLKSIKGDTSEGTLGGAVRELLRVSGDEMIVYSAKPSLKLEPEMPLHKVMAEIYTHLLYVMEKNTQGIIDDTDIEFLHDFRVSVRRVRSAMSLIRGVFEKDVEKEFRTRFRELGGLTGMARDMDVYLDTLDVYDGLLPEWLKGGMNELGGHFVKTREAEYKKLGEYLRSGHFEKLAGDWRDVVTSEKYVTPKGRKPVLKAAKKAIHAAFAEIERQAEHMNSETHSDAVHEIRISFKKIRYLLEFYSSLFDKEKTGKMLKDMKTLQDSLGDHNDYHVQQLMLEELIESGKWSAKTASACGYLSAVLADKQAAERANALELIGGFMEYKPLFEELFV